MPPAVLAEEIKATREKTTKNFGVNLIVMHPLLAEMTDVVIAAKVSFVVFAGGLPPAALIS
ncbi:MAG: 2-nitropropane dioxygenase, partial [Cyanobacteriota bacterium]